MRIALTRSFLLLAAVLFLAGCRKYDEGPAFSIWPKKVRLEQSWSLVSAELNGNDVTANYPQLSLDLSDGGSYSMDYYIGGFFDDYFYDEGTWELENRKKNLVLRSTEGNGTSDYQILRLKMSELWLIDSNSGTEFHFSN